MALALGGKEPNSSIYERASSSARDGSSTLPATNPLQRGNAIKGPKQPSQDTKQVHSAAGPIYENTRQMSIAVSTGSQRRSSGTGEREDFQHLKEAKTLPRNDEPRGTAQPHEEAMPTQCKRPANSGFSNMTLPPQGMRNADQTKEEAARKHFKSFGERFVKEVWSRDNLAFTDKLCRQRVIPESIQTRIVEAKDQESANSILYNFLCHQATCESLHNLLAAMIEADDYPAMSKLGGDMKQQWTLKCQFLVLLQGGATTAHCN